MNDRPHSWTRLLRKGILALDSQPTHTEHAVTNNLMLYTILFTFFFALLSHMVMYLDHKREYRDFMGEGVFQKAFGIFILSFSLAYLASNSIHDEVLGRVRTFARSLDEPLLFRVGRALLRGITVAVRTIIWIISALTGFVGCVLFLAIGAALVLATVAIVGADLVALFALLALAVFILLIIGCTGLITLLVTLWAMEVTQPFPRRGPSMLDRLFNKLLPED